MKAKVAFVLTCVALCSAVLAQDAEKPTSAPEIVYIHYSTPEEADLARQQILAQYEALGGSATIVHENAPDMPLTNDEAKPQSSTEKTDKEEPKSDN